MAWQGPFSNVCKSNSLTHKIRHEDETHLKGQNRFGFVTPLYVLIPKLGYGSLMSIKDFTTKYDLYCEGLNPKCVKVPRDISFGGH